MASLHDGLVLLSTKHLQDPSLVFPLPVHQDELAPIYDANSALGHPCVRDIIRCRNRPRQELNGSFAREDFAIEGQEARFYRVVRADDRPTIKRKALADASMPFAQKRYPAHVSSGSGAGSLDSQSH